MLGEMDKWIGRFAAMSVQALESAFGGRCVRADAPGTGAAGGAGFALCAYLGARLLPGLDLVIDATGLRSDLQGADLVLTGEGRLDAQTLRGKVPAAVARAARQASPGVTVVALCGALGEGAEALNSAGIDAYFPVISRPMTEEEAMRPQTARRAVEAAACQAIRLFLAGRRRASE